ncbi:hypothetical protein C8A03DRAFT_34455 [Achaetomium macrosporum]|uniref:Uncharacterized protein n=1 Tax=Achaetomium macrosporum TaxID=79813 RepID=A0AAN7HAD8_9PEZI|nr:hypothetical protein C8A03DRAFT_34455 [Achaetomium macrosporum]
MSPGKKSKTSPPRNETPEQATLRRLREFRNVRQQYFANLARWRREREDILAELRPAHDRAQRSHEAVMALSEKIDRMEMEIVLLADTASETKRRRQQGRRPEDEYHNTVSAAEKKRHEEEKKQRRKLLQREVQEMKRLYASYESEDQADAKEYKKLERELEANKGHIASVERNIAELDRQIEQLERQLQQAEREQHGRDRHRRHDDRDPKGPPPGGSGGGSAGGYKNTGVWDAYTASRAHGRGGGYSRQTYRSGSGGGGGYGYRYEP